MDKKYLVATNDFIAAGGDGFPHLGAIATENEFSALDEALVDYIEKLGIVDYKVEGRITTGTLGSSCPVSFEYIYIPQFFYSSKPATFQKINRHHLLSLTLL